MMVTLTMLQAIFIAIGLVCLGINIGFLLWGTKNDRKNKK